MKAATTRTRRKAAITRIPNHPTAVTMLASRIPNRTQKKAATKVASRAAKSSPPKPATKAAKKAVLKKVEKKAAKAKRPKRKQSHSL